MRGPKSLANKNVQQSRFLFLMQETSGEQIVDIGNQRLPL